MCIYIGVVKDWGVKSSRQGERKVVKHAGKVDNCFTCLDIHCLVTLLCQNVWMWDDSRIRHCSSAAVTTFTWHLFLFIATLLPCQLWGLKLFFFFFYGSLFPFWQLIVDSSGLLHNRQLAPKSGQSKMLHTTFIIWIYLGGYYDT